MAAALSLLCIVGSAFASSQQDRELQNDNNIMFAPIDVDACRPVGEETATVLSFMSPFAGFASLTVDWGDDKSNTFGSNIESNVSYFYFHAYDEAGRYEIKTKAAVKQLNEDGTSWKSVENEMVTTVQVRNNCDEITTDAEFIEHTRDGTKDTTGNSVLSNWYDEVMAASIEFAPVDDELCLDASKYAASTISVASLWSGHLSLTVDWGDGQEKHYNASVDRGLPYSFDYFYEAVGTYTITASAVVARLAINGKDWETIYEELSVTVNVRDDCSEENDDVDALAVVADDGDVTGEWSIVEFAPLDTNLCRDTGEEATALTLMSIFSGQLTVDVSFSFTCYCFVEEIMNTCMYYYGLRLLTVFPRHVRVRSISFTFLLSPGIMG